MPGPGLVTGRTRSTKLDQHGTINGDGSRLTAKSLGCRLNEILTGTYPDRNHVVLPVDNDVGSAGLVLCASVLCIG